MSTLELAREERRDLAELCAGLAPEDWDAPSLCAGWRVRDVVAHVVSYEGLGPTAVAARLVRSGLWPHRANALGVQELSALPPQELLRLLREAETPTGLTAAFGGRVALADTLIHHQDVRRPLGLARQVPAERLRVALPLALLAPVVGGAWHVRGVRVVATDLDWAWGRGPEARGPGEAVLMAVAGRAGAARDLDGPGARVLQERLG